MIFAKLGFKGSFSLGHLDQKHMQICLQNKDDSKRIWLREVWFFDCFPMRIFRSRPDLRLDVESSIIPRWISLPNLPLFLFNKQGLFYIGSLLGKSLTLDVAIADLFRPSVARICVEIDVLKRLPVRIWLDCESIDGFWQDGIFE